MLSVDKRMVQNKNPSEGKDCYVSGKNKEVGNVNPYKRLKVTSKCEELKECIFDIVRGWLVEANLKKLAIYARTKYDTGSEVMTMIDELVSVSMKKLDQCTGTDPIEVKTDMSARVSKVLDKRLSDEGKDCGNGRMFKETGVNKHEGKLQQKIKKPGVSGFESKVIGGTNTNGRSNEMGGNNLFQKPKITGEYKDIKKCVFTRTKYDTGLDISKMIDGLTIKLRSENKNLYIGVIEHRTEFMMANLMAIIQAQYNDTISLAGLSTGSASDYRNHRIEVYVFTYNVYGIDYVILHMANVNNFTLSNNNSVTLKVTTDKKARRSGKKTKGGEQCVIIFHQQLDEAVRNKGVSDNNDSNLATNADRIKNILCFHTIIIEVAYMNLGPKGMDKLLQSVETDSNHGILITNNGAAILKSVNIKNTAAKVLVEIPKVRDNEVGDNTKSADMFCDELFRDAELLKMTQRIHLQAVAAGWQLAQAQTSVLDQSAICIDDAGSRRQKMMHVARLEVDAVIRLKGTLDLQQYQVKDSYQENGLEKQIGVSQTQRLDNCKILLASTSMKNDMIKFYNSRVGLAEKKKMRIKCKQIIQHGCKVLSFHQLICHVPESVLAKHCVMTNEHAYSDGIKRLTAAIGGEVASTFDHPELVTVDEYDVINGIKIGENKGIFLGRCKAGESCKIVMHGSSSKFLDTVERFFHDTLSVLTTIRVNIYTCLMDKKFESLRSGRLENENTPLHIPEETEKIIHLIERLAGSPEHDTDNREQVGQRRLIKLKDEMDLIQNAKEKLAKTEEKCRKCHEHLKNIADVKICLKRDGEVQSTSVSEFLCLETEIKSLLNSTQEDVLGGKQILQDEAEALRDIVTSDNKLAICLCIDEVISNLNPAVMEELLRLRNKNEQLREFAEKRPEHDVQYLEEMLDDVNQLSDRFRDQCLTTEQQLEKICVELGHTRESEENLKEELAEWVSKFDDIINECNNSNKDIEMTKVKFDSTCTVLNIHTHGLHLSPEGMQDNNLQIIKPKENKTYVYKIPEDHPSKKSKKKKSKKVSNRSSDSSFLEVEVTQDDSWKVTFMEMGQLIRSPVANTEGGAPSHPTKEARVIKETLRYEFTVLAKRFQDTTAVSMERLQGRYLTREEIVKTCEVLAESQTRNKDLHIELEHLEASLQSKQPESAGYEKELNLTIDALESTRIALNSAVEREKMTKGTASGLTEENETIEQECNRKKQEREKVAAENYCAILSHIRGQKDYFVKRKMLTICHIDHAGRILSVNRAAYKVFGWSESKFIGSNISMIVKKDHDAMHDQYVKQYRETGERYIADKQYNDLDGTFVLAQRIKVSHNILYQDTTRTTIINTRNTQQDNIYSIISSDIDSNKFEIQDCQTEQMLKDFSTQRKRFFEIRRIVVESKLSDAFKECVGYILFIESTVPNKGLRREALTGGSRVYCFKIVTSYLHYAYQKALHKGLYDIGMKEPFNSFFSRFQ